MTDYLLDGSQDAVVRAHGGEFLVLAPPGCGKTHVLAERIRRAHALGTDYEDMLCLTFTNRAARGMKERIRENISDEGVEAMYVGNIHRFCSRFLLDYALVPAETGIIDDDDIISIMAQFLNIEEDVLASDSRMRRQCFSSVHLAAFMCQIEHCHSKELRIHPECLSKEDLLSLKRVCKVQQLELVPAVMSMIYRNASGLRDLIKSEGYFAEWQPALLAFIKKAELALQYDIYKKENSLVDFEDLLLLTYDALAEEARLMEKGNNPLYRHYSWCQVDEVQDLNPLQMKIVDLLMLSDNTKAPEQQDKICRNRSRTMMFLGDEQQAIFSFMGAKMSTLERLKERCSGNIFRLYTNHRSPKYLLDVFNTYAEKVLKTDSSLLPSAGKTSGRIGNELSILCSPTLEGEYSDAAQQAQRLLAEHPEETTAVIVLTNSDAILVSKRMDEMGVRHFKVSGNDIFATPEVKLLIAHLAVFANENNFIAWSRLLKGFHIYEHNASARAFMRTLTDVSLTPEDLMLRPGSSYVKQFAEDFEETEIVVFDTETTGLNVCADDIIQIAAVKMRGGKVVEGSSFSVFIETERAIPEMLGDIVNPIIEERKRQKLLSHAEALRLFTDYIGSDILLGHNADYDYMILDANLKRYLPGYDLRSHSPIYYDTLKLTRLLEPHLHQYKLKYLLKTFRLSGENSHLADADVEATCSVAGYCFRRCKEVIPLQEKFLSSQKVKSRAALMRSKLLPARRATMSRLAERQVPGEEALVSRELRKLYSYLLNIGYVRPLKNIEYVFRYISRELINPETDPDLRSQIANHILEISALKESDLCSSDILDEKIIITTVHKAKGLEFDNVIVFDANGDRYPGFFSTDNKDAVEEDKRKFYVALTRAKKRIIITLSATKTDWRGRRIPRSPSSFFLPVAGYFTALPPSDAP